MQVGLNGIPPSQFKKHISGLSRIGLKGITTQQNHSNNPVFITFDDGYECVYELAYPILEDYEFKAIVFPIADFIGKENDWDINFSYNKDKHLSIDQLVELLEQGWEVGSHGCHHISYSGLKYSEIYADMAISKEKLEQTLGKEVVSFTAPFNMMTPVVYQIAEEIGYKNIFLQKPISKINYRTSLNVIERRMIYRVDTFKNILYKVEGKSRYELYKENIIHFCSNATIGVKELI